VFIAYIFSFLQSKLKESQYQVVPWRSDMNQANFSPQSPSHSVGAALATSVCLLCHIVSFSYYSKTYIKTRCILHQNKDGLELVPQSVYSQGKTQVPVDGQTGADWSILGRHQSGLGGVVAKNVDADELGRHSPLASR